MPQTNKIRLAKAMADAGLCSRREAERWIEAGRVELNDKPQTSPAITVSAADKVVVDGVEIGQKPEKPRLFLYNKPSGIICSADDPEGRPTVFDKLPKKLPRVVLVGRLDLNSEGLLLLTTDGAFAGQLMHPSTNLERTYKVRFRGDLKPEYVEALAKGITIDGTHYRPAKVVLLGDKGRSNHWAEVTITEGKNREIRRLFNHFGLQVNRLMRIKYGPFELGDISTNGLLEIPEADVLKFMKTLG
jgi:23S rRNA pseudouridine2605 synthase